MTSPLFTFLNAHRVVKGDPRYSNWNITGINKHVDVGSYIVEDHEYDTFLSLAHTHIFGPRPKACSLLERHRDDGPGLIDLDFRYEGGGPLVRRFVENDIRNFVVEYAATMIYFSKIEDLTADLEFYVSKKPLPETEKGQHKDGVHIQCPYLITSPKYQYAIRGSLLSRDVISRVFGATGVCNPAEDCYDVSVIHRNNWFLYGACKPDKAQYSITSVFKISIESIRESFDAGNPTDMKDLVEIVNQIMVESDIPTNKLEIMKMLSIRYQSHTANTPTIRPTRAGEWEELMIAWGSGKAKSDKTQHIIKNTIEFNDHDAEENASEHDKRTNSDEDSVRVTSAFTIDDIKLAYRLCNECLNAERRAGEYHDWINLAICLKNISNTDDSFRVWVNITRAVDNTHKKAHFTDAELRAKWSLVRVDSSKKLSMGSLQHWAEEDNPDKRRAILSETYTDWIINVAKNTHVSIAEFVCRMYRYEFRCCLGSRKGHYEWYQFQSGSHSWKHLRSPTEVRARLSSRIKDEYIEAWRKLGRKSNELHNSAPDGVESIEKRRDLLRGIERNLEMAAFKDCVLRECQEKFYDDEFIGRLNSDPYLVAVNNGVLELNYYENENMTGRPHVRFRDGRPDDNVSFLMGDIESISYVPYNPDAPEQRDLKEFFAKIYPDPVLREYVITLLSSCLEGSNREQRFYVMQGVGSNGKSMIEMLMEMTFGDYGTSLSTTVFTRKRPDSNSANPDIITIQKRRYIHTGEPDDNEKINTAIMKQYSGGDRIAARGLFSDQEKFSIMGKIFMSCNDLPPVSKMDNGTWRRLRVIPHISVFKDPGDASINPDKHIYEKDLHLENKLKHWRTAFLSLLVHYYETHYLEHGLREPDCVVSASNKYKEENDLFNKFFNDNFVRDPCAGPILVRELRGIIRDWKRAEGGRASDLKENIIFERMKEACGAGSNDKEFWGIRIADDIHEDISGGIVRHS